MTNSVTLFKLQSPLRLIKMLHFWFTISAIATARNTWRHSVFLMAEMRAISPLSRIHFDARKSAFHFHFTPVLYFITSYDVFCSSTYVTLVVIACHEPWNYIRAYLCTDRTNKFCKHDTRCTIKIILSLLVSLWIIIFARRTPISVSL